MIPHSFPKELDDAWLTRLRNQPSTTNWGEQSECFDSERFDSQVSIVARAREYMLENDTYYDIAETADMLTEAGLQTSERNVETLINHGYILAIPDHEIALIPSFQFDAKSMPRDIIYEVTTAFEGTNPWDVLQWLHFRRTSLEQASYAEAIKHEIQGIDDHIRNTLRRLGRDKGVSN